MTWEEATALSDAIAASPDAGALHVRVAVAPQAGYAVIIREHGLQDLHYVWTMDEFKALCERLMRRRV